MLRVILIVLAILIVLFAAVAVFMFCVACVRDKKPRSAHIDETSGGIWKKYGALINGGVDWFLAMEPEKVSITSYDGLRLSGLFLPAEGEPLGAMLLMHGYRSTAYTDFSCAFRLYHEMGYDVLSVFQRAHGDSEGKYICYGVKERFDCRDWCRFINENGGGERDIFLAGLSMGCTTVLMATGLQLPENVRGVIADCGFSSPWDEFTYIMKQRMHIPVHPLLDAVSLISRCVAGFGFKDYSVEKAMETNKLPVLFFHGGSDRFVPAYLGVKNYEACKAPKELVIVDKAAHGESYLLETERYVKAVRAFLEKYQSRSNSR